MYIINIRYISISSLIGVRISSLHLLLSQSKRSFKSWGDQRRPGHLFLTFVGPVEEMSEAVTD